ncbi:MAG: GNAT family N-acetyltransferase [Firmicutes bacterium]|nr:GNAT family N-acetyltransferase [Bacillota bacterium]
MSGSIGANAWVEELLDVKPEPLRALMAIEADAFGIGGMNEWFLPPFVRQGRVFVLWQKGIVDPVGVAECMRQWQNPQTAYLFGFAVRKDRRGEGLGTFFMQELILWLTKAGFERLELTVSPSNDTALHIYKKKLGFVKVRRYTDEYGPGEDRLLLGLDLMQGSADRQGENGGGRQNNG